MSLQHTNAGRASWLALAIIMTCGAPLLAAFHQWTSSGPEGGFVLSLALHPNAPSRVFAGVQWGGVYRSLDSGASWIPAIPSLEGISVRSIVVDPRNAGTLFAGTDGLGLYKTADGGATWKSVGPSDGFVNAIVIDPVIAGTVYAGTSIGGVLKSLDDGETWIAVNDGLGSLDVWAIAIDPRTPKRLYAGSSNGRGIYRSTNGGQTWTFAGEGIPSTANVWALVVDPTDPKKVSAGTSDGLFRSVDSGAHWSPGSLSSEIFTFEFAPSAGGALYAGTSAGLSRSTDGGATWNPLIETVAGVNVAALAIAGGPPDTLYANVGGAGVFKSIDGGTDWTGISVGIHNCFVYSLAADPDDASTIYAGADGIGVVKTVDAADSWFRANAGLTDPWVWGLAIDPADPGTVFAGAESNNFGGGVFKSTTRGTTWQKTLGGANGSPVKGIALDPAHPGTVYAVASPGGVYRSDDGGSQWSHLTTGFTGFWGQAIAVDPAETSTVYVATEDRDIFKSTDRGDHWSPAGAGLSTAAIFSLAVDPSDPATLYAGSWSDPVLYKSANGGGYWAPISAGLPGSMTRVLTIVVDPASPQTIYIGGFGGVFRSEDGGSTWSDLIIGGVGVVQALTLDAAGAFLYAGTLASGVMSYQLHFLDVPASDPFRPQVESVALAGITSGCGRGNFCPAEPLTRAQAAVWLLRAEHGQGYAPPPATGVFADVPTDAFAAAWIEALCAEGIASGCGGGNFCPDGPAMRAQMAVFLLRAEHGSNFVPPPATGLVFTDVPADAFAAPWIEELANEGISSGCGGGNFCPDEATSRAQAAALLVRTFGLQ